MTRKRDRAFAMTMALLFFITAFGFSFFVIWQLYSQRHQNQNSNSSNNTNNSSSNAAANCTGTPTEAQLAAPTIYKPSGQVNSLQITDLQTGTGQATKSGDCLTVKYYGSLASNGTVFDENFTKDSGFEFPLGQGMVIQGWDQGLVGMKVGGLRRLVIPASLAYGNTANASIPANSTLVFEVKLLNIQN